ncbi:MAG: hypothetical protein HQK57_16095 [Deltaproteobacteria bacterium]|nr:hypothetical protein [Deltaproteobacteria bacterium]MBF0510429.1 hypothetical protein [Deltaproteobacteria bacterium]MBF0525567.1 hypothetical protein [Deltaproteobacteria bacterium]
MPAKIFEHVKKSELPVSLLEGLGACFPEQSFLPNQTFRVTIEPETREEGAVEPWVVEQRMAVFEHGRELVKKYGGMTPEEVIKAYKDDRK